MQKFTKLCVSALMFAFSVQAASAKDFLYTENFDDDASFSASSTVPDGWLSKGSYPFSRYKGSDLGVSAHSGNYVFATLSSTSFGRDEVFMTKALGLKGGVEYSLSFFVYAPGGTPSSVRNNPFTVKAGSGDDASAMTEIGSSSSGVFAEWTKETFKFKPETDGDYRFAVSLGTKLSSSGIVAFDDIEVSGSESDGQPVVELPYSQSFDNENQDYHGGYLPGGWLATGTVPFVTANISEKPAVTGEYYMITDQSAYPRDEYAYTPFFAMKSGVEYTVEFHLYMPGDGGRTCSLAFSVGSEQNEENRKQLLALDNYVNQDWEKYTVKFTPKVDGNYCFAFALTGDTPYSGVVAIDDFRVSSPQSVWKPTASFSYNGLFNIVDSKLVVFPGTKVKMYDTSSNAATYKWTVKGATPETSEDANPEFVFPQTGTYEVVQTVSNSAGESTLSKTIDVTLVDNVDGYGFSSANPSDDRILGRGSIPTFDTDKDYDFVTGLNHYYYNFAEKYDIPEGEKFALKTISMYLTNYSICQMRYRDFLDSKFSVVVYGVKDGRPDFGHVYGRYDTTMEQAFGSMGLGKAEMRGITLDKPINVDGPFFLAFEFDKNIVIDETDKNLTRSHLALGAVRHASKESTLYVQPVAKPDDSDWQIDGGYCKIEDISEVNRGLGLSFTLLVKSSETSGIALDNDGKVKFAARFDGDMLTVSGTENGESVVVFNSLGQQVAGSAASAQSTSLTTAGLPKGVYVVKCGRNVVKLMKM